MKGGAGIALIFAYMMVVGFVARVMLGVDVPSVETPELNDGGGGILDALGYVFGSIGTFIALSAFAMEGVPVLVNIVLNLVSLVVVVFVLKLIRGVS